MLREGGALPFFVRQAPRPEPATPDWPGPRLVRSADFCNSRIASAELARAGQASGVFWTEPTGLLPRSVSERKASFYGFTNRAAIGSIQAMVEDARSAPDQVAGILQLQVLVPEGVAPGPNVPLVLIVGSAHSQGVTIAVK